MFTQLATCWISGRVNCHPEASRSEPKNLPATMPNIELCLVSQRRLAGVTNDCGYPL